jgi:hypothetical protein
MPEKGAERPIEGQSDLSDKSGEELAQASDTDPESAIKMASTGVTPREIAR